MSDSGEESVSSTRSDDRSTEHPISPTRGSRLLHGLRILILVPIARLRFLFILGVIGALILHWDDLVARYAKWVRPIDSAHRGRSGSRVFLSDAPNRGA